MRSFKPLSQILPTCLFVSSVLVLGSQVAAQQTNDKGKAFPAHSALTFEQNLGQTDSQIRFLSRAGTYRVFLTDSSAALKIAAQKGKTNNAVVKTALVAYYLQWDETD